MQLNNIRLENSYNVCVFPADSSTAKIWQFPYIPQLESRKSIGIQLKLSGTDPNTAKTNLGIGIVSGSYPCFLTLVDNRGNQFVQNIPVSELNPVQYATNTNTTTAIGYLRNTNGLFVFAPKYVAWNKCFLSFPTATGLSGYCVMFNIFYV